MRLDRRAVLAGVGAAALAACSQQEPAKTETAESNASAGSAAPDPAATIRPLYNPYLTEGATFPAFREQAPWSAALWAQLEAMMARSEAAGEPILDFDPLIDAQDYQLNNLSVTTDAVSEGSHAVVRSRFSNAGRDTEVVFDLVWEQNGWRVDNIRTAAWDLRQIATG